MASIGQLIRVVADLSGLDESSVKLIARYLRESGLIGQQSTGAGAARMTPKDAAALLMGVNGSDLAKDAVASVICFSALGLSRLQADKGDYELSSITGRLEEAENFGEALASLIEMYFPADSEVVAPHEDLSTAPIEVRVDFHRPNARASIVLDKMEYGRIESYGSAALRFGVEKYDEPIDRKITVSITQETLSALAGILKN